MVIFLSLYESSQKTRSALFFFKWPLKQMICQFSVYLITLQHCIICFLHKCISTVIVAVNMSPLCTSITTNPFLLDYGKQLIEVEAFGIFLFCTVGGFLTTVGFSGFFQKTQIASVDLLSNTSAYLWDIFQYKHTRFRDSHWHSNTIIFSYNRKSKGSFKIEGPS